MGSSQLGSPSDPDLGSQGSGSQMGSKGACGEKVGGQGRPHIMVKPAVGAKCSSRSFRTWGGAVKNHRK